MKRIDLGQKITILANVGVIAGIIFLGFELAQNQRAILAQTRNEMTRTIIDLAQAHMNQPTAGIILRGNAGESLSDEESFQFSLWASSWLRFYENVTYQYRQGLFDEEEWRAQREIMGRRLNTQSGLRMSFCSNREVYSRNMVDIVDELLEVPC